MSPLARACELREKGMSRECALIVAGTLRRYRLIYLGGGNEFVGVRNRAIMLTTDSGSHTTSLRGDIVDLSDFYSFFGRYFKLM
jgi:hypothetical protein